MLEVRQTAIEGVLEIRPPRFLDQRGFFSEVWNDQEWREAGIECSFVQDNHSVSRAPGVLRGLHFQKPPAAQDKLVRVTRGSVFDVAVDIRRASPTFGQWIGLTLSATEWNQLFVPRGFAHGFVTLEPDTEVQYKLSAHYSPEHERCLRFDDPEVGIAWPISPDRLILSDKDRTAPMLADLETGF